MADISFEGISFKLVLKSLDEDGVSRAITRDGIWEPDISRLVLKSLQPNDGREKGTLVDIGANIGWYSMLALAAGHRVVAIDAFSANIALIKLSSAT